ncbi:slipin family protein [Cohnella suwonensis]|uniref:Slipin family protein n=1 Tax=Cohnella suwonensis TaxID=696072 RepID=A0ABW0M399_9BACL
MAMKAIIRADERGLLFKDGNYVRYLKPGTYRFWPLADYKVVTLNVNKPFSVPDRDLQLFLQDAELANELTVVDVQDYEYALHFEEGKIARLLPTGQYAFWKGWKKHDFVRVDAREPEIDASIDVSVLARLNVAYVQSFEVATYETGVLFIAGKFRKTLAPGKYYFWKGPVSAVVKLIDMRQLQLDLTGQEMMTEDKATLRLNFVAQYRIADPLKALELKTFEDQLYVLLQLVLREYVGSLKLDDLLRTKQEIGTYVLDKMNKRADELGVVFQFAGVKDIILPGDVKEILNTVLIAEKQAQANLITRREETASTRSLLNTAKLLDENETLYRLKELEFMERICDKVGTISLSNGGTLLEQLNAIVSAKGKT